ncbi:uncharacterized protein LOC141943628 isoform X1 [Strix uralensis]|uniref:uncharacterized protein LOC141943628 isoform X1 n=1 Tax=Strix uralensis TaxID=36305 RepID=UPI003DA6DBC3
MVICYRLSSNHNSFWCPTWGMKFEIMAEREDAVITTKAVTLCESSEIIKQRSKGHNSKGAEGGVVQSLRSEGRRSAETAEELPGRAASPPASALTSCGEDAALPRPQEDAAGQGLPGTSRLALTGDAGRHLGTQARKDTVPSVFMRAFLTPLTQRGSFALGSVFKGHLHAFTPMSDNFTRRGSYQETTKVVLELTSFFHIRF